MSLDVRLIETRARNLREFMSPKDRDVSADMLAKLQRYGSLSDRQWSYLGDIVARAMAASNGEIAPTRGASDRPTMTKAAPASFPRILAMFSAAAAAGIKTPRVRFLVNGQKLALATSNYPNSCRVIDAKAQEGSRAWHGWIDGKGWHKARACGDSYSADILKALQAIEADPIGAAKLYGQLTSECNMCGRELTTRESLSAGYGPICAGKYGLAWGHVDAEKLASMRAAPQAAAAALPLDVGNREEAALAAREVAADAANARRDAENERAAIAAEAAELENARQAGTAPAERPRKPSMAEALASPSKPYDDIPF